jgi:hypothetical protein
VVDQVIKTGTVISMIKENKQFDTYALTEPLSPDMVGNLNDLLRQQLGESAPLPVASEKVEIKQASNLNSAIEAAVSEILTSQEVNQASLQTKLNTLFEFQKQIFQQTEISSAHRARQYISKCGLVMSPEQCITTQTDVLRVHAFIRAIDQALTVLRDKFDGMLHIAYPACGPFAPLLLPLIAYYHQQGTYHENDLCISLVDMQPGAVISLEALTKELNISQFIYDIHCQDATEFTSDLPIHMVVLEAMQHGFSREGHLQIARHFANIMEPNGAFIPQEVSLRAVLSIGQAEFIDQWQDTDTDLEEKNMLQKYTEQRVELGDILTITAESLRSLNEKKLDENTSLIECNKVKIPTLTKDPTKQMLLICTRIKTYGVEGVGEYDSGITHPLPDMNVCINFTPKDTRSGDLLLKSGDYIKFYYRLNGLPGFLPTWGGSDND